MRNGFSMIELIFVIVMLGILAAIAIPKFAATRVDAEIAKGRSDVASIRSAIISERQARLIKGETNFIDDADLSTSTSLFSGVLSYGITPKSFSEDGWRKGSATNEYIFRVGGVDVKFTYDDTTGIFTCKGKNTAGSSADAYCSKLVD